MNISQIVADAGESFFAQLPENELTANEAELARLLREIASVVQELLPRSVSLQTWAERRLPGDVAEAANGSGLLFIKPSKSADESVNDNVQAETTQADENA